MDKHKDPGQIIIDLRQKFREATTAGILSGNQRSIFELTLISILNEAEEQRQRCLKIKLEREREAARAEAQAVSFNSIQNTILLVFGSILDKVRKFEEDDKEAEKQLAEEQDFSEEEKENLAEIEKKQKAAVKARTAIRKKSTKKTASKQ
jgi:hypothetical protein